MLAKIRNEITWALEIEAEDERARQAWAAAHVADKGKFWFFTLRWADEKCRIHDILPLKNELCGYDDEGKVAVLCIPWRQGAYLATRTAQHLWLGHGDVTSAHPMPSTTPPINGCRTHITSRTAEAAWAAAEKWHGWLDRAILEKTKRANPDGDCVRPQDSDAAGGGSIEGGAGGGLTTPESIAYAEAELILFQEKINKAKLAFGQPLEPEAAAAPLHENMAMPDGM